MSSAFCFAIDWNNSERSFGLFGDGFIAYRHEKEEST
jgi:hypothetical protein